jgi:hypothetical protein
VKGDLKMIKDRKELEQHLDNTIKNHKHERDVVNSVKDGLSEYGLLEGETQKIFMGVIPIERLDKNLLTLFSSEIYEITKEPSINPINYFTPDEIKKAIVESSYTPVKEDKSFPIVIDDVIEISPQDYIAKIKMSDIVKLYNNGLIDYDFRAQRNARIIKKGIASYRIPNLDKSSVRQIRDKILNGTYFPDLITLNLILGSNDDGDELSYNPEKKKLYIKGGSMHILDGFHRLNGFVGAMLEDKNIELDIPVMIKNYDIDSAAKFYGQINTINVPDEGHVKALKSERYSDLVVRQLMTKSDLKGRVSQSTHINDTDNQIVTYSMLSDTIDEVFELNSNRDTILLVKYLGEFFDFLIGSYEQAFITNTKDVRKESLINHNVMFSGFIVLAQRFKENNVPVEKVIDIIDRIDFSKENNLWEELGVLNNGTVTRMAKKQIKKFFYDINLGVDSNVRNV